MELSKKLTDLISASLADNKISSKEKEILTKRAVLEGIDKDEFELYLDSLKFSKKEEKGGGILSKLNQVIYHREAGFKQEEVEQGIAQSLVGGPKEFQEVPVNELKIRLWHILAPIIVIASVSIGVIIAPHEMSVDEALNVYDFEAARSAVSTRKCSDNFLETRCPSSVELVKIITQEVAYMTENSAYPRAVSSIEELNAIKYYEKLYEDGQLTKSLQELKDDLYFQVLSKGLVAKDLSEDQANVYLSNIVSVAKIEKVRILMKR